MSDVNVNDVVGENGDVIESPAVAEVTPEMKAATTETSSRKKKVEYPVPDAKLTWPFADDLPEYTLAYSKLSEANFQTVRAFKEWEYHCYYVLRIERLEEIHQEKIKPHMDAREVLRVGLEESDRVNAALNITDDGQKEAVADILGTVSAAMGDMGLTPEQIAQAVMLLQQGK